MSSDDLHYLSGYGNALSSEARPGALPRHQNSPRNPPYGLYPEQINGTSFVTQRDRNRRVWLYRLRPQVHERGWEPTTAGGWLGSVEEGASSPELLRFAPLPLPGTPTDFLSGVTTFGTAGDPALRRGLAVHVFGVTADMQGTAFSSVDGDLLFVPWDGALRLQTELGWLHVAPGEIAIVPRAIRFRVEVPDGAARGWLAEVYDGPLLLPQRGPVGANGMADERHFHAPVAAFEDDATETRIVTKQGGRFWQTLQPCSPFDVVAWHGTHLPFKYALKDFNSLWSVSFDHPDPSILTVLTVPADDHGLNALDVAVFLGRWDPTEHTFRPPFLHRNAAIEFNTVVSSPAPAGPYVSGAFSFTPYLSPHGVAGSTYRRERAKTDERADRPERGADDSIWVQLESCYGLRISDRFLQHESRDRAYLDQFTDFPPADLGAG